MKRDRTASGLLSLYAMIFVSVVADVAVVPLLPTLTAEHGLTSLETALLLSTTTFAMVVVTLPLGRLADRVGARPLVAVPARSSCSARSCSRSQATCPRCSRGAR